MTTHIPRSSRSAGALALAAAVLLSACGGGDGGGGAGARAAGQATGSVEDQLGFTRKGIQAAQAKVENEIATCMRAQGFEYVPVDPGAAQAALTGRPSLSDEQFEAQFGYGISTLYDRASAQSDPNARIRQALSAAEQRAYDSALSGGNPEQTFFRATDSGDFTRLGGCTKKATDALFGGGELLTTLQRKLDELDESILADQRMVRAQEAWRSCVRDAAGGTYEDSEAIEEDVAERLAAIVGPPPPPGRVVPPNRSYDRGALAALQRLEVRLSDTDIACEKRHITPVETSVREAKETRFREVNAELLRSVKPLGS